MAMLFEIAAKSTSIGFSANCRLADFEHFTALQAKVQPKCCASSTVKISEFSQVQITTKSGSSSAVESISADDLNEFMVHLKKKHQLDNNSVIHNMIIVAQFLKKQGRAGLTRSIDLPEAIDRTS